MNQPGNLKQSRAEKDCSMAESQEKFFGEPFNAEVEVKESLQPDG